MSESCDGLSVGANDKDRINDLHLMQMEADDNSASFQARIVMPKRMSSPPNSIFGSIMEKFVEKRPESPTPAQRLESKNLEISRTPSTTKPFGLVVLPENRKSV